MRNLGDLEHEIMNSLWDADSSMSVRDVMTQLTNQSLAYTTVMTVVNRLCDKGLVTRERSGRAYLYTPVNTRESVTSQLMNDALDRTGSDRTAALVHFARGVSPDEATAMREALARIEEHDGDGNPRSR